MNSTRRQFVTSTMAGLPVLMYAHQSQAQERRPVNRGREMVLNHIDEELVRLHNELHVNPRRTDSMRAFESSVSFLATFLSADGIDTTIAQTLKARIDAEGRDAVVRAALGDERTARRLKRDFAQRFPRAVVDEANLPPAPTLAAAERALDELLAHGCTPTFRAVADHARLLNQRQAAEHGDRVLRVTRQSCGEGAAVVDALWAEAAFLLAASFWIPALAGVAAEAGLIAVIAWGIYALFC